ncbi:hypothetical protein SASPL_156670 [Salvia splendens]|uniref:Trichome birefringence-like family n=1 Tax=Salvia splendens TaxID=180675 RepID=A0A8X8VW91_SALSN|nr:hypothetical protein SASPL_156670 [Salvia splendens]
MKSRLHHFINGINILPIFIALAAVSALACFIRNDSIANSLSLYKTLEIQEIKIDENPNDKDCDLFTGKWVFDNVTHPLYREDECRSCRRRSRACEMEGEIRFTRTGDGSREISHCLKSNSDDPDSYSVLDRIIMPKSIQKHGNNWKNVDYLIFNTYIWWMNTPTMKILGTDWGSTEGVKCAKETAPLVDTAAALDMGVYQSLFAAVADVTGAMRVPVSFLNITRLSKYRKDAHTSLHMTRHGKILTAEQKANPAKFVDCIHWCLPGLPDTWNELLYARIISHS